MSNAARLVREVVTPILQPLTWKAPWGQNRPWAVTRCRGNQ